MCGRYQFTAEQCEEIIRIAKAIDEKYGAGTWTQGEIRPTNRAPVLVAKDGEVCPELQTWGYKLPDSLVINARAETAAEKPIQTFRTFSGTTPKLYLHSGKPLCKSHFDNQTFWV